jgi:hypothetical protein
MKCWLQHQPSRPLRPGVFKPALTSAVELSLAGLETVRRVQDGLKLPSFRLVNSDEIERGGDRTALHNRRPPGLGASLRRCDDRTAASGEVTSGKIKGGRNSSDPRQASFSRFSLAARGFASVR